MRRGSVLLLVAAALAVGIGFGVQSGRGRSAPPPAGPEGSPAGAATGQPAAPANPLAATPSRREVDAAAGPGQRYVVVDAETGGRLAGTLVRSVAGGAVVATAGDDGRVTVAGHRLHELVFCRDGYLAGFYGLGQSNPSGESRPRVVDGARRVRLYRDVYSIVFDLRFVGSDGRVPASVRFRLSCLDDPPPVGAAVPDERLVGAGRSAEDRQRWLRQRLVAELPGFDALLYHFGVRSGERVYRAAGEARVRFAASGRYRLEALSSDGEVARTDIAVRLGQRAPRIVELGPGAELSGVVVDAGGGAPVSGARVELREGAVGVGAQRTGPEGRFALGPLPNAPVRLLVSRPDFEPAEIGPRAPGSWTVVLTRRTRRELTGQVRSRPGLAPLAGARVKLARGGAAATTGEDGRFALPTAEPESRLVIECEGYLRYVEIVRPGESPATFDLLPATPGQRVRAGLTALLRGRVLDAGGAACAGMPVRVLESGPPDYRGLAGRRILEGGVLALSPVATADAAGRFELECATAGPVRVVPVDGAAGGAGGVSLRVALGRIEDAIVLRATPR